MSITTETTIQSHDAAAPTTGPVARIIAGSLAAGATIALVLDLVVFAGGTESTITGSALIAFGFGWALIATLTARYTSHPQRWTAVPAVAMGITGLAVLVFAPGNAAIGRISWVWPPVAFAMAVWMFVQMRRSLTGRGRWLLTPVIALLGLASVGATYENVAVVRNQAAYPAPGNAYDVGGHSLHLDCRGSDGPTVVLFNGMGEISASWARITDAVDDTTRVCAYDRAGQGWSDDAQNPQDGINAASELHALLDVAGEHGPYVLVGHSIGGTYAMTYAAQYPGQVAGLVLLDTSSPEQFTTVSSYPSQYAVMRRGLAMLPTLARFGLGHTIPASHLPSPAADQVAAMTTTARSATNGRDELSIVPDLFEQAQSLTTLGDRPLAVVTASDSLKGDGWSAAQDRVAALSTNAVHWTADSTHSGLLEDEGPAAESVRAITDVIAAVRTGTPLDGH